MSLPALCDTPSTGLEADASWIIKNDAGLIADRPDPRE
jgi:hypothetical protein